LASVGIQKALQVLEAAIRQAAKRVAQLREE
jgi:hypothetical protein